MSLTKTSFYNYSGYSASTVNDQAVDYFLTTFQELIEEKLGYVFSINAVTESDKFNYFVKNTDYQNFIIIGAWQESGLTIKQGSYDDSNSTNIVGDPLVEGQDYELFRFKTGYQKLPASLGKDNPVVAIKLYCNILEGEFLRIYGNWGFSNGLPDDLCYLLYTALKNAIEYNDSTTNSFLAGGSGAGGGAVEKIKEYTTAVDFSRDEESRAFARNYFLDFLNSPNATKLMNKYLINFEQTNYFI